MAEPDVADDLVRIDPNRLDAECRDQSRRYLRYAKMEARAKHAVRIAADQLEVIDAEIRDAAARNPGKYGLGEKPTIPAIESVVIRHARHRAAKVKLMDAENAVDIFHAAVSSLWHRKNMLEKCVDLEAMHYRTDMVRSTTRAVRNRITTAEQRDVRHGMDAPRPDPTTRNGGN